MLKRILAFVVALLGGYTAAVLAYSQLNLSNLTDMGVSVSLGDRFATFGHDLLSMAPVYLLAMFGGVAAGVFVRHPSVALGAASAHAWVCACGCRRHADADFVL